MIAFRSQGREFRTLATAAFIVVFLSVAAAACLLKRHSTRLGVFCRLAPTAGRRAACRTMRVLQVMPGDAEAVAMALKGLRDKEPQVRGAAALSLGTRETKSAIPKLEEVATSDKEGSVVMAAAKARIRLGDEKGYGVYYAVLTGQRKTGEGLVGGEEKELNDLLKNPKELEAMAFEQGIGFVPFGGYGLQVYEAIHASESKEPIVKATSIKLLTKDPDARTEKALFAATADKHWLVRAAAYEALARRGHSAVLPDLSSGLKDDKEEVRLTAAAAVAATIPERTTSL